MLMHYANRETRCAAMLEDIIRLVVQCLLGYIWDKGWSTTQSWKLKTKSREMHGTKKYDFLQIN